MKNIQKKISLIETILLIFNIIYIFFITGLDARIKNIIAIIFLVIVFVLSVFFFSYKKDNNFDREQAIRIELSVFIGFFFIYFLLGLLVGFSKTKFSISINEILNGLIPTFIILLLEEFIRYILFKSVSKSKKHIIIITILFIVFNVLLEFNLNNINNNFKIFIFITTIIFPILSEELLCSYLTYNFGFLPTFIFKSIEKLYIFIIPIFPNLTDYLYAVFNIIVPFIIYLACRKYIVKVDRLSRRNGRDKVFKINIITIPLIIVLLVITALVSGLFQYQLIAIASGSMEPTYYRGDALLIYKIDANKIQEGDILIYKNGGKIIAHRVIKKTEFQNKIFFNTKGDANLLVDEDLVEEGDVIGRVDYIIKYIGYPTIWLNELLRKE